MNTFGAHSQEQLNAVHPDLVAVLKKAIARMDFQVVEGFRGRSAQHAAYAKGFSKLDWPHGNHNHWPSLAADVAPFPVDWSDASRSLERFVYLQGIIWSCAADLGIQIRQGIDWNRNQDMRDEHGLHDYPHVELYQPRVLAADVLASLGPMPV